MSEPPRDCPDCDGWGCHGSIAVALRVCETCWGTGRRPRDEAEAGAMRERHERLMAEAGGEGR